MSLPLSVFIICCNEIERIEMVLQSVAGLASDIVVVDSGSTDGTIELVQKYTDRVYTRSWTGFGDQKVFGEAKCRYNWILNLDADEVLSMESQESIRQVVRKDPENTKQIPGFELRVTMMASLEIPKVRWLAPYNWTGRLYDKRYAGFSNSSVHDKLINKATGGIAFPRLSGPVYHYSIKNYSHMWAKIGAYSDLQAKAWIQKGRKPRLWLVFLEAPLFFCKHYFLRRLFALGARGFVIAFALTAGRVLRRVMAADRMNKSTRLEERKDI